MPDIDSTERIVFLSEPGRTGYDLKFSLFGFPIRVHPAFFILPILLGRGLATGIENVGVGLLLVAILFFVSVLIHELGHAFAFRRFGVGSHVVLYWMGGLAVPGGVPGSGKTRSSLSSYQDMFVSFAGPLAGFLLAAALVLIGLALGGRVVVLPGLIPLPLIDFAGTSFAGMRPMELMFNGGIAINIWLNVLNLVPIFPLDGGQISQRFLMSVDQRDGYRNSIYLSIGAAVVIAVIALGNDARFMAIFFGFMAWSNFQRLQFNAGSSW